MPDPEDCRNAIVWKCRAIGAAKDSVFIYELSWAEQLRFYNLAEGKFVELSITDITRPHRCLIRVRGAVSIFDWCHVPTTSPKFAQPELFESGRKGRSSSGEAHVGVDEL